MTEEITPYNGVYYLPVKQLGTRIDDCPYELNALLPSARVIPFSKARRLTVGELILTTVRRLEPECARTKSLDEVARMIKGWPLEKRCEVRQAVKSKLDNDYPRPRPSGNVE